MKFSVQYALVFLCLFVTSAASEERFNPRPHLNLNQCWNGKLTAQLECLDQQLAICDNEADASGVPTSLGRYACGYEIFEQVDALLNTLYARVISKAQSADAKDLAESGIPAFREDMVLNAQRSWIPYRDEMCDIKPSWVRMGSGRDSVMLFCAARLTLMQIYVLDTEIGF